MPASLVAIAGGTSQLGRAIVEAILDGKQFTPVVLSRESSKTPDWLKSLPVEIRRVDYLSLESCATALTDVHTVISTLLCKDGTWYQSQKNLLDAGLKGSVKRFVPSEFGLGPGSSYHIELFASEQIPVREALQQAAKDHPDFEWTAFYNGQFTNYLGYGSDNKDVQAMDHSLMWQVKTMEVDIPVQDDGTVPDVTMTTIADTGRFVAAALTLPHGSWPEESYVAGQTLNLNDLVPIVERVRGQKLTVRKHTKTSMQEQIDSIPADSIKEEDFMGRFFLQLSLAFADGTPRISVMPPEVNNKFPEITTTKVEEYVTKAWGLA